MADILITTSTFGEYDASVFQPLQAHGFTYVLNPFRRKLTEQELIELFQQHQPRAMIAGVEPITRQALAAASRLQVISRCGSGLDSVDVYAAREQQIAVEITPQAPVAAVKELAVGFMFNALRKLNVLDRELRAGNWTRMEGRLLEQQVVGVVGLGRIGQAVAETLHRFGCRVLGYDTRTITSLAGVEQVSLEQLFRSANVITLHLPGTPDTERIINAASLQSMRDDVVIINTARGELVDEQALFDFLSTHKKAFACLDTFWEEPYKGPLLTLPNTLLTSHIGSFARESRIAMEQEAVRNLLDRLR